MCAEKSLLDTLFGAMQKAAKGGRLNEHQYLRQNLGLAVTGVMTLFYLWKTPAGVLEPIYQTLAPLAPPQ